jgi:lysophospholipase L1-like esterase
MLGRLRAGLPSAALALTSSVLALAALELALRFVGFDPLRELREGRDLLVRPSEDPDVIYELVPGARGQAWGTNVVVNSHGFRGPEPSDDHAGLRRIAVLGDSVTFGNDLPEDAAYPRQLEARLADGEEAPWEVLNFGLGGYDTLQEVALLEHRAIRFRPEIVIVGFSLNDAGVVSVNRRYIERLRGYAENPVVLRSRLLQYVLSRFDRRFIADYVDQQARSEVFRKTFEGRIDPIEGDEALLALMEKVPDRFPSGWYRDPARVGRIRHAFRRLARLSEAHGFAVAILLLPRLESGPGGYPHATAHQIIAHEAGRYGFAVIDPVAAFLAAGMATLRLEPDDRGHPNATGHRIVADELERWVAEHARADRATPNAEPGERS